MTEHSEQASVLELRIDNALAVIFAVRRAVKETEAEHGHFRNIDRILEYAKKLAAYDELDDADYATLALAVLLDLSDLERPEK